MRNCFHFRLKLFDSTLRVKLGKPRFLLLSTANELATQIDEIQNCSSPDKIVNHLHIRMQYFLALSTDEKLLPL